MPRNKVRTDNLSGATLLKRYNAITEAIAPLQQVLGTVLYNIEEHGELAPGDRAKLHHVALELQRAKEVEEIERWKG